MIIFVTDLGKTIEKLYIYEKNHENLLYVAAGGIIAAAVGACGCDL